ncbi:MAG: hypothetical protein KAI73_05035 [Rhodospirillaceae bacterium]|nr:hypothetical protein [Rhodospirillaceae bacterium]
MTNQAQGRKKSLFPVQTTVLAGAAFDYVVSGVNFSISFANLLSELGATGTMQQEGAGTGTPILDVAGSINGIRDLEAGSGIQTSVSAQNGAVIEHNFQLDAVGVPLSADFTIASPVFRSLVAGDGIDITESGDEIEIKQSVVPISTKTVVVNDLGDLPTPVGGVITLAGDTKYLFNNDIDIGINRFVVGNNCVLDGADNIVITILHSGSGIMFTSANSSWTVRNLTVSCGSGTFIDFDGSGTEIFQLKNSVVIVDSLGTIDDFQGIHIDDTQFQITTDGFLFGGTNGVILIESTLGTIAAGTLYDLGTATFNGFAITDSFTTLNGTSVFLDGAASSANITSGNLGSVHNCRFFSTGTPLQTITIADIRWQFAINDDIQDTNKDCLMSQVNNAVETVISVVSTPVKLLGSWNEEDAFFFSTDATGKMTYIGEKDIEINVDMSFSGAPASGTNKDLKFYVAKNGTEITNSGAANRLSSGDAGRTSIMWRVSLSTNDFIEAFVENNTDTVNVLVTDAVLRLS